MALTARTITVQLKANRPPVPGEYWAWQANKLTVDITLPDGETFDGADSLYCELHSVEFPTDDPPLANVIITNPTGDNAVFEFTGAQTNQTLTAKEGVFWLTVFSNTGAEAPETVWGSKLKLKAHHASLTTPAPPNPARALTQDDADDLYAPISHTHAQSEITGLVAALSGKASTSHTHAQSEVTGLVAALALLAPLASPAFTGVPTAPTASNGTNTTQIATCAFVLANAGSGGAWGSITGTLADQTDLDTALGLLAPLADPNFSGTQNLDGIQNLTGTVTNLAADVVNIGTTGQLLNLNTEVHFDAGATFSYEAGIEADHRTALGLGNAATLTVDADIATLSLPASTTISAFGATLVDDANAATARTTLGAAALTDAVQTIIASSMEMDTIYVNDIATFNSDVFFNGLGISYGTGVASAHRAALDLGSLATQSESITPTWTGAHTINNNALGTTTAARLSLTNTTAAAAGAQQVSPAWFQRGNGWKTTATAASQTVDFQSYVLPVQGTTAPSGLWKLQASINGAAMADVMSVSSAGQVLATNYALNGGDGSGLAFNTWATLIGQSFGVRIGSGSAFGLEVSAAFASMPTGGALAWTDGTVTGVKQTFLTQKSAANIRQGAADAAAPVAQTSSVQNVVAGTTDTAGANRTYAGSRGTGTGVGGAHIFTTAPAGGAGSSQNALVEAVRITGAGVLAASLSAVIGSTSISASAVLEAVSTTKGFLPPKHTTTQRDAVSSPAEGLIIYNTTTHKINVYTGSAWEAVTSA